MKISQSESLLSAASNFKKRFLSINSSLLELDAYNSMYLQRYREKIDYHLYLICHILEHAGTLTQFKKVVDLGGGIGFHSAFLRQLLPDVELIYLDVDSVSMEAAKSLHSVLRLNANTYVCGTLSDIDEILDKETLIISRDVIEHIYDLEGFFKLSSKAGKNVHNTAAIKDSLFRKNEFREIHYRAEKLGNSNQTIKARDHKASYFKLRQQLIKEIQPGISNQELNTIAELTRGLNKEGIEKYMISKEYPTTLKACLHTNTCDPYTGNWAERLLSPSEYRLFAAPLTLKFVYPSYNALTAVGYRKILLTALNIFTKLPAHRLKASFSIVY